MVGGSRKEWDMVLDNLSDEVTWSDAEKSREMGVRRGQEVVNESLALWTGWQTNSRKKAKAPVPTQPVNSV